MIPQTVNTCSAAIAACGVGAWLMDIVLPVTVLILSIVWLSLNIIWFIWCRYKEWRKRK